MATHSSDLAWKIPWTEDIVGYSPWGCKESDTTERLHLHQLCISILSFLSFQHVCQFYFHFFFPQLVPCFWFCFLVCALVSFLLVGIIFGFLCWLDCFDFAYGCVCICVYSVTIFIVVNLCHLALAVLGGFVLFFLFFKF